MKLATYLAIPGNTATKLANDCGVSVSTITRAAANGNPSLDLMRQIAKHTEGAVTANDFMEQSA